MNTSQYLRTVMGLLVAILLIWIGVTGKLGSVLGALITPGSMLDTSSQPATESNSQTLESSDPNASSATGTLSPLQIGALAFNAGIISQAALSIAIAIALAESGGRVSATHSNTDGSTDYGLWQINGRAHPSYSPSQLVGNASYNAAAMFAISAAGTNWNPWTTFTSGAYRQFLGQANTAASQVISNNVGR